MSLIKASVVQAAPVVFDTVKTMKKLGELTREAAGKGANLVVFPAAFVGGYPKGLDFGARIGLLSPEGREEFRRCFESTIDLPGPEASRMGKIARDNGVHTVVGVIERDGRPLYCSTLTYAPSGKLLYKRRKLMSTALARLVWEIGDGSTIGVVDTPIGRIGSVICLENYMPLLRAAMYARGVELYCAPTGDDRDVWLPTMLTIALEGRRFVISACQFLTRGERPADYALIQGGDPVTVLIRAVPASWIRSEMSLSSPTSPVKLSRLLKSTDVRSYVANMISMWSGTTPAQTSSSSPLTRGLSLRSHSWELARYPTTRRRRSSPNRRRCRYVRINCS